MQTKKVAKVIYLILKASQENISMTIFGGHGHWYTAIDDLNFSGLHAFVACSAAIQLLNKLYAETATTVICFTLEENPAVAWWYKVSRG